jgi:MarR family transcriptional regulator, transcriptional regulator for hemolysin
MGDTSIMIKLGPDGNPPEPPIHPEAASAPGYLANHAARVFNRKVDAALRPHGISMALIGPVLLLSWQGPMLQRDLVRLSAVRQPAMVALLDRLEAMGMIEREPSPTDRRAALVRLTPEGHAMAERGRSALYDANRQATAGFTESEAQQVVLLLARLIDNLDHPDGT